MKDIPFHSHHGFSVIFLVGGLKVQPQVSVKQYRFHRLASKLILEPITGELSHYARLSHFAPRYATLGDNLITSQQVDYISSALISAEAVENNHSLGEFIVPQTHVSKDQLHTQLMCSQAIRQVASIMSLVPSNSLY